MGVLCFWFGFVDVWGFFVIVVVWLGVLFCF